MLRAPTRGALHNGCQIHSHSLVSSDYFLIMDPSTGIGHTFMSSILLKTAGNTRQLVVAFQIVLRTIGKLVHTHSGERHTWWDALFGAALGFLASGPGSQPCVVEYRHRSVGLPRDVLVLDWTVDSGNWVQASALSRERRMHLGS
jgi:hypothetical protein